MAIGSPIYGFLADRYDNREKLMTLGSIFLLITFSVLLYSPISFKPFMFFIAFLVGFHCGTYSLAFSSMRLFIPKKTTGLSIAFMMIIVMVVVAIITQLIGLILSQLEIYKIDFIITSFTKYKIATAVIPVLLCIPPLISRSFYRNGLAK
jgi:MFS family permease